ncbi:MAG TPA: hypothetical protein PLF81_07565 [Candidatus Anammoximicrobium sp.]|mgnify:FL=1|nr:hypothetical protein [Candidatus Anammoximicrobium sp.]
MVRVPDELSGPPPLRLAAGRIMLIAGPSDIHDDRHSQAVDIAKNNAYVYTSAPNKREVEFTWTNMDPESVPNVAI